MLIALASKSRHRMNHSNFFLNKAYLALFNFSAFSLRVQKQQAGFFVFCFFLEINIHFTGIKILEFSFYPQQFKITFIFLQQMSKEHHSLPPQSSLKVTAYFLHICQRDRDKDFSTPKQSRICQRVNAPSHPNEG